MILWKRAVLHRGEFAQYAIEQERLHQGWWPHSYRILRELEHDYTPQDEPQLERIYKSLAAGANIFKITRRGRFTDFDTRLVAAARTAFPAFSELVIHDVGASSAITSLELYRRFQEDRPIRLVASDYFDQLTLVELPQNQWLRAQWTVAFDPQQRPIQTTGLGAAFGTRLYTWRYALSRLVQHWVNWRVIPAAQRLLERGPSEAIQRVSLFHPEAVAQSKRDPQFQLIRHDMFQPNPVPCHIVRALNVITPDHITPEQIQVAIRASTHNLIEGGWLILGRSIDEEDGRLRATVYQWTDGQLVPQWHQHEGYEWPELVAELTLRGQGSEIDSR